MFRKSKSRNNLRRRLRSDEEEVENCAVVVGESKPSPPRGGPQNGTSRETREKVNKTSEGAELSAVNSKANTLLSFDDIEGDDVTDFKLRKKDTEKRIEKLEKRAKALRKKEQEENESNDGMRMPVILGNVKQERRSSSKSPCRDTRDEMQVSRDSIKQETPDGTGDTEDDKTRSKFKTTFGQIPDAQAVYEARKKREKMRLTGASGIIPLDDVQKLKDKSVARSRLVREDDNDMSDEETESFYSSKKLVASQDERRREEQSNFLEIEQGDDESEQSEDEELSRWESEQMRKGVSLHKVEMLGRERQRMTDMMRLMSTGTRGYSAGDLNTETQPMDMDMDIEVDVDQPAVHGGQVSGKTSNVTLEGILSKLRLRIQDRDEALNGRESELQKVETNIKENKETIIKLKTDEPRLQELFTMYQEIRAYSRDLMECLSEKVDEIKNLESRIFSVVNSRAQRLRKRRRQDVHDVYDECSACAAGKNINTMRAANITQRASEREARRARRRRNRENTLEGVSHEDGLSTDDEETNSEMAVVQQAKREVSEALSLVFVDALDDFCRVDKVMARFVDWLALDETSFTDAYIQLCIPKLLSPFMRLELLDWDPLEGDERPLYKMRWYESLLKCASSNADLNEDHEIIVSFIPLCIERIVMHRIADMVQEQWDPLSLKQCTRLGFILDSLIDESPTLKPSCRSVKRLLEGIRQRVQEAIDEDLFVPIYSKQAIENIPTGCKTFLDRQFWTAVKLIRCVNCLSSTLSEECMKELILDGILRRSISVSLQCSIWSDVSILRKCKAVIKTVPVGWWVKYEGGLKALIGVFEKITQEHMKGNNRELAKEIRRLIGLER